MVDRARIRLLAGVLTAAVLPALPGCAGPYYDTPPPPYPPYYYDYYYYPHVDVYFHIYTGDYWYHSGGYWHRAHRLPPHIYLDPRYRVVMRIPDDHPYKYHDEHRRKYPYAPQPAPKPRITPPGPPPPQSRPEPRAPAPTRQRPAPTLPQTPPSYEPEKFEARQHESRQRDQDERQHNRSIFEEYRKKPWPRGR